MTKNIIKKWCAFDALSTADCQQDEAALAKMASSSLSLSMSCQSTKVIGISFSSFCILFTEGFSFTVDCHFGFQH